MSEPRASRLMTVGELSRRTGVSVKALREYCDAGIVYSAGRSSANYRMFDESALWCVGVIRSLRSLGLTVAEIRDLAAVYLACPDQPIGPRLAAGLGTARARIDRRIDELQDLRRRIDEFEAAHAAELEGGPAGGETRLAAGDPRGRRAGA